MAKKSKSRPSKLSNPFSRLGKKGPKKTRPVKSNKTKTKTKEKFTPMNEKSMTQKKVGGGTSLIDILFIIVAIALIGLVIAFIVSGYNE